MWQAKAIACAAALALAMAGCGDDDEDPDEASTGVSTEQEAPAESEDTGTTPVGSADVTLTEFRVRLRGGDFPREGVYTLNVVNDGDTEHALEAEGPNGETETDPIPPGGSAKLDAYFVTGRYELYCPIGDHQDRGMRTTLAVARKSG